MNTAEIEGRCRICARRSARGYCREHRGYVPVGFVCELFMRIGGEPAIRRGSTVVPAHGNVIDGDLIQVAWERGERIEIQRPRFTAPFIKLRWH